MNQQTAAIRTPAWLTKQPPAPDRSLFLHGMWRSGTTYVWSCFREAEGAYCYYEPLAPGLNRLTRKRIPRDTPAAMAANRHPIMARPYFAEFEPLLRLRGVPGFKPSFTFDRFALAPGDRHPDLERYIRRLTTFARRAGQTGVLGFNQTAFRIAWLAQAFDSYNVQVERDPRDIWASYMEHRARGNFTYFRNWMLIVERNAGHPLLAPLAERLTLRRGASRLVKAKAFYAEQAQAMTAEQLYFLVAYLWIACALHALSTCDLILDTGLAKRPGYVFDAAATVATETGLQVDFTGLRSSRPATDTVLSTADDIEREAAALFPRGTLDGLMRPDVIPGRLAEITARKSEVLMRAI